MLKLEYSEEEPEDEGDFWSVELTVTTDDANTVKKLRRLYRDLLSDAPSLAAIPRGNDE